MLHLLGPEWPRHSRVRAAFSTRFGGVSTGAYASLNLAQHVADDAVHVRENRRLLRSALSLPAEPMWLDQVHGTTVRHSDSSDSTVCADASWTDRPGAVCAILTADCLPVLFADDDACCVAAAHAGWRGLAAGVLESTVSQLPVNAGQVSAWLGPAIGSGAFEVGDDVRNAFLQRDTALVSAFQKNERGRWLCNLYAIARARLAAIGVTRVYGGDRCTFSESDTFFSYRRDGICGRMASVVWLEPS